MRVPLLGVVALVVALGAGAARGADPQPASALSGPEFKAKLAKAIEAQQKGWVPASSPAACRALSGARWLP